MSAGQGKSIALDSTGSVYTTGSFRGTMDFDPGVGTALITSIDFNDFFVSKLDNAGNFLWAKAMGGTGYDNGSSITVDSLGNVYITGWFQGTVDFDPGVGTALLTSAGDNDTFVSKLDIAGNFLWAKAMGGDASLSIAMDSAGSVFTTGYFQDTADFDPGTGMALLTSAGGNDVFVSKLDNAGNFLWAKAMGGTGNDIGDSIAVDSAGNVYTTGSFRDTMDFDPCAGTALFTSAGLADIFISKLSGESEPNPPDPAIHTADQDADSVINLTELLRVIQLFNLFVIHCDCSTEDGFAPLIGDQTCTPHSSDYIVQDWSISLGELLRVIQFFNLLGYSYCPGVGEDDFCPGTP